MDRIDLIDQCDEARIKRHMDDGESVDYIISLHFENYFLHEDPAFDFLMQLRSWQTDVLKQKNMWRMMSMAIETFCVANGTYNFD